MVEAETEKKVEKKNLMEGEIAEGDLAEQSLSFDWHTRRRVAWNPCTSEEILQRLARDDVQWVREAVAGNKRTPEDVLVRLAGDCDGFVRAAVALNTRTPAKVLDDLAADEAIDIRLHPQQESLSYKGSSCQEPERYPGSPSSPIIR